MELAKSKFGFDSIQSTITHNQQHLGQGLLGVGTTTLPRVVCCHIHHRMTRNPRSEPKLTKGGRLDLVKKYSSSSHKTSNAGLVVYTETEYYTIQVFTQLPTQQKIE